MKAEAHAARWDAGAEGERRTAVTVQALAAEGWFGLFDRAIPGLRVANADIVLITPAGNVLVVDAKLWHRRAEVRTDGRSLHHGDKDYSCALRSLRVEKARIQEALQDALRKQGHSLEQVRRLSVTALIAMHNAPVAGGGFTVDGIRVVPAERLLPVLRGLVGTPDPMWSGTVAAVASTTLPRYEAGGRR
ncbi:nuclease-related domain-containing protein [Streptomyces filamentosus]|uniref:nuclease-related domain-containing protein n=1 Tax=Streptomyces filamentosus TaxID=67294 RepID=UPI0033E0244D